MLPRNLGFPLEYASGLVLPMSLSQYSPRRQPKIAYVEDDPDHRALIDVILGSAGYHCEAFDDASGFLRAMNEQVFDALLVDWVLPGMSGLELVRLLRQRADTIPILGISNLSHEQDIIQGLNAGADDYLTKPVRKNELLARINALLRRGKPAWRNQDSPIFRIGNYEIDKRSCLILLAGQEVDLTPREYDVALFLFQNVGRLIPRQEIERAVWGHTIPNTSRTVDTHVYKLRTKLALGPQNGVRLVSIYSYGYRLDDMSVC